MVFVQEIFEQIGKPGEMYREIRKAMQHVHRTGGKIGTTNTIMFYHSGLSSEDESCIIIFLIKLTDLWRFLQKRSERARPAC